MQPDVKNFLKSIGNKRTLITFHSLGDLDAVGSALALKYSLKNADVVAPDRVGATARRFLEYIEEKILLFENVNPEDYEVVIVLETSSRALLPHAGKLKIDCIIDHHSIHADSLRAKYMLIEPSASSTCEIVYSLLEEIDEKTALCLLVGIIADSANFRNANERTFEAVSHLLRKCKIPYTKVLALTESEPDVSQRIALIKACGRAQIIQKKDVLIVTSSVSSFESHAASALVSLGADFAFVGNKGRNDARISARMRERFLGKVNLAEIMNSVAETIGGTGGGHPAAAGATGNKPEKLEDALQMCVALTLAQLKG